MVVIHIVKAGQGYCEGGFVWRGPKVALSTGSRIFTSIQRQCSILAKSSEPGVILPTLKFQIHN